MTNGRIARCAVLVLLLAACKGRGEKPTGTAPPATTAGSAITAGSAAQSLPVTLESEQASFAHGIVIASHGNFEVVLNDPASGCGEDASPRYDLRFEIPQDANGKPATGRDVNVWVQVGRGSGRDFFAGLEPWHSVAHLEPFELRKGARVHGTLTFRRSVIKKDGFGETETSETLRYEGSGTFDAEICADPAARADFAPDPAKLAAPLAGTWKGQPLSFGEGIATVVVDTEDGDRTHLQSLMFAAGGEPYDCASAKTKQPKVMLSLDSMGGTAKEQPLDGPQRVSVSIERGGGAHSYLFDQDSPIAWIRFDQLAWQPGGLVRATLVAESKPGVDEAFHLAGRLTARVCEISRE